jgi:pimeloyl-ACP methyl ester carboxylesterase/DNA-binding CsgD family transcriptional regulator
MKRSGQRIRYVRSADGVKLAWAEVGCGPALFKAANWLTHLEHDLESPVWRHWVRFFSEHFRFLRHDERGCGMTDWNVGDVSMDRWVEDLEAVVDAADPEEPFVLLGISQGAATCVSYALKHPERVSKLILYGAYARGAYRRDDHDRQRMYRAMIDLIQLGWGSDNPTFRQVFTSRFIPGGSHEQLEWFNDLCQKTTSADLAERLLEARAAVDITSRLAEVMAPTLVLHSRYDEVVPITEGRILAAGIPNAEFVELDSRNHVLLEDEPAWKRFCDEVLDFAGIQNEGGDAAFESLSKREAEVFGLITEGLGNADIADRLSISEKTVRNHVSNIFDKLGVWTRAQAIVFARDRGYSASTPRR